MIGQTAEYALRAMAYLATRSAEPQTAQTIAKATELPSGYVIRVLQLLRQGGLITAQRGPNGGFLLARSTERIRLLDIFDAVQPIRRIDKCPLGKPSHLQLCPLHRRLDQALAGVQQAFAGTTLAELVEEMEANERRCQFPSPIKGGKGK